MQHEPLIHVPVHCLPDATPEDRNHLVERVLVVLESYHAVGNTLDVLVTTNDDQVLELVDRYRSRTRRRFELVFLTRRDLLDAFRTEPRKLLDRECAKFMFSKFFPILRRFHERVVHVDNDTLFRAPVDFARLFAAPIGFVDANGIAKAGDWDPSPGQIAFYGLDAYPEPSFVWVNTGVFCVQEAGFDICRREVDSYLANLDRANALGVNQDSDEFMLNALVVREPTAVAISPDYNDNFLSYYLKHDPDWRRTCRILHFHGPKPQMFRYRDGRIEYLHPDPRKEQGQVTADQYLAALFWYERLHVVSRHLGVRFPGIEAMPLEFLRREVARIEGALDQRAVR